MRPISVIAAALLLGVASTALAQPAPEAYPPSQQQWVPSPPPPPTYGQADADYQAQLREYRRQKREYDRQRAAYEAQFGGGGGYAYPPPAPPPQAAWRSDRGPGAFGFNETQPFHEGPWLNGDHGARWYRDRGCRLATPRGGDPDEVIPVCPDSEGRYLPA